MAYFVIVAGESSGDILGSSVIRELKKNNPGHEFQGITGPRMTEAGCESWFDIEDLSVMGIFDVIRHLPRLYKIRNQVIKKIIERPPDAFIGIDYPEFNLSIEGALKRRGIQTIHMVSPSFWAWRENRIKTFNKKIDLMLCLFPFEEKLLEEQGLRAIFIGHPLADSIPMVTDQITAKKDLGINDDLVISLMPGSRRSEISFHAKLVFDAANKLKNELATSGIDSVRFLVPSKFPDLKDILIKYYPEDINNYMFLTDSKKAISASNIVITKSGTSTLESALYKKPTVVIYRMPTISYLFLKLLNVVKTEFAALPNILLEKEIFPELIQNQATSENIKNEAIKWINQQDKVDDTIEDLTHLHRQLRKNAGERAAQIIEKAVAS